MILAVLVATAARAECYKGVGPLDTLADLRGRFPGATFERLVPAWAQESDVMYSIVGKGMSGTMVVMFADYRPYWRDRLAATTDSSQVAFLRSLAEAADDDVGVRWVRWIPEAPIPLDRFITKYGTPETSGFGDEDMRPYKHWVSRGLVAYLNDAGESVTTIDFEFTRADSQQAWMTKYGFIPEALERERPSHQ